MASSPLNSTDRVTFRTHVLARHLHNPARTPPSPLEPCPCLNYSPPELSEKSDFDIRGMRRLMDGHHVADRDWLFGLMTQSNLFCPRERGGRVFVSPDYNQSMEQQREMTMRRIEYLLERGVFQGWLTGKGPDAELRKLAFLEVMEIFDHSLAIKLGVQFFWCVIVIVVFPWFLILECGDF